MHGLGGGAHAGARADPSAMRLMGVPLSAATNTVLL